jgi:pimeloyl-ACP methyl ester carboxylesterase
MSFRTEFLTLGLVLLAVGGVLCAGIVVLLARSLIQPPRMTDGKAAWVLKRLSPGDLGLQFEEVSFQIRDAGSGQPLKIAGWWIPHPQANGQCVILIHGYADAKVGSIAWAPTWHSLGRNILAIDLRAHGESGGRYCTGGFLERHDVSDVIDQLRAAQPSETRRLALFGVSLGAAVAVATAAMRDDIDALVLDSPVPDFSQGAMIHMELLGAPGGFIRRGAVALAQRLTGARYDEVRLVDLLPRLKCPVLIIAPQHDALLESGMGEKLRVMLATKPQSRYWLVSSSSHLMALATDPATYRDTLQAFLHPSNQASDMV